MSGRNRIKGKIPSMGKVVGITYDLKTDWERQEHEPEDFNAELDSPRIIDLIENAFQKGGHTVKRIGNIYKLMAQIDDLGVDIVFNICEGRGGRNRESQVPLFLEMKGIPFVGADALTLGITLDKVVAKKMFVADGIPTPRFFVAHTGEDLEKQNTIGFPLIVKTLHEGTSKGISDKSRVEDLAGLRRQVDLINKVYHQPALVEEFIKGKECTVAVLGNGDAQAMPIVQTCIDGEMEAGDKIYTFERIQEHAVEYVCPAKFPADLTKRIQDLAVKVYQSVGCRDFGRVDFRIDEQGNPYVLEINPLPSLSDEDAFGMFPKVLGYDYNEALNRVLNFALARYGMVAPKRAEGCPKETMAFKG